MTTSRAKIAAEEMRQALFLMARYRCVVCDKPLATHGTPQLAHRVPKTKGNLTKFGAECIHHPLNLVPVCSLTCNDKVSLGSGTVPAHALMDRVIRVNTGRAEKPDMAEEYRKMREEFVDVSR